MNRTKTKQLKYNDGNQKEYKHNQIPISIDKIWKSWVHVHWNNEKIDI